MNKLIKEIENKFKSLMEGPVHAVVLMALHNYLTNNSTATEALANAYLIGITDTLVNDLVRFLPAYLKPEAIIAEPFIENLIKGAIPGIVADVYAKAESTT